MGVVPGGNAERLAHTQRAWNARAMCLTFAVLGLFTAGSLLLLPQREKVILISVATGICAIVDVLAYFIVRRGLVTAGTLLLIFPSLAQHVVISYNPLAAQTIPYFASVFVMIGATCLERRWLWPVYFGSALCVGIEWQIGLGLGIPESDLRGSFLAATVLLSTTSVVAWLYATGMERTVALGKRYEQDRKELEERLQNSARMEALGRLASGIAHDFNNLLVVMQGSAEIVKDYLDKDHPALHELEQIEDAGVRAESLTFQLLAYSRRRAIEKGPVDVKLLLNNLEPIMRRLVGPRLKLNLGLPEGTFSSIASETQLEQIVLNLLANARDASKVDDSISVSLSERRLLDALSKQVTPGNYIELTVSDTGAGMSDEVMQKVFEPFFTTKADRGGTGLGLATSRSLVEEMGGTVLIESELGHGSTFRVLLPSNQGGSRLPAP